MNEDLVERLRLVRTPGIGPVTFGQLMRRFGSAAAVLGGARREVMAVPGSPLDRRAQGCNQLIRDGVTLVQNARDVVEELGPIEARVRSASVGYLAPSLSW